MDYGQRLKKLREETGLSQKELTDRLMINRSTYARYETSSTQPDFDTLNKLANYFNVTIDYILGRTDIKRTSLESNESLTKNEKDIAKRMKELAESLEKTQGLAFDGEPMSDEAKESLLEAMEFAVRTAKKINKKYTPKKYLKDDE